MPIHERIVIVGGAKGICQITAKLKLIRRNITLVQTVFDGGGHTGLIRREMGIAGFGDLRRGIATLGEDGIIGTMLNHRFEKGKYKEDSLGNLMMLGLYEINELSHEPLADVVATLSEVVQMRRGRRVLPVSLDISTLCAILDNGTIVRGEEEIDARVADGRHIVKIFLDPPADLYVETQMAIENANKIVLGPGDHNTSVGPNLIVNGMAEAIGTACDRPHNPASLVYVMNLMTKPGETDGYTGAEFAAKIYSMLGREIDYCICNNGPIPEDVLEEYSKAGSVPVAIDERLKKYARYVITGDFVELDHKRRVRHGKRIASVIANCERIVADEKARNFLQTKARG